MPVITASTPFGSARAAINTPSANVPTPAVCGFGGPLASFCTTPGLPPEFAPYVSFSKNDRLDTRVFDREEQSILDLMVERDLSLGALEHSSIAAGMRYASLESQTSDDFRGIPDWQISEGFIFLPVAVLVLPPAA